MSSMDVLISFDTTGSMSGCIRDVRKRITEMVDRLFSSVDGLRMGVISHGDYYDGPIGFSKIDFTSSKEQVKSFILNSPNTHGGDEDEFYEYVLQEANKFDWQSDKRMFVLIGDSGPHEIGYTYKRVSYNIDWKKETRRLYGNGVKVYTIQCLDRRDYNYFYESVADNTGGKHVGLSQFSETVETILATCYHQTGQLDEYRNELTGKLRMNRNLARMFQELDGKESDVKYTARDSSGLVSVHPSRFQLLRVTETVDIKSFVENNEIRFKIGRGFYQFTKSEMVQEKKEVILRNKDTGDMFSGPEAREFIGLPFGNRGKISPKFFDQYEVYIQSTSPNRKLMKNTKFLYERDDF